MKLLIVDDEMLTRTGLISSISWENLGIDEVYEASDGIEGLKMAEKHKPEIILSDVRMPRMNGIDMLYKVRENAPDTVFIFMSGYSDKEYLKAAIKLRAVNYVEKPLDLVEIEQAVRTAGKKATVMMFGLTKPDDAISLKPYDVFSKELTLRSSYINPYTQARALALIESGRVDVTGMVCPPIPLEKLPEVLSDEKMRAKGKFVVQL